MSYLMLSIEKLIFYSQLFLFGFSLLILFFLPSFRRGLNAFTCRLRICRKMPIHYEWTVLNGSQVNFRAFILRFLFLTHTRYEQQQQQQEWNGFFVSIFHLLSKIVLSVENFFVDDGEWHEITTCHMGGAHAPTWKRKKNQLSLMSK